MLFKRRDKLPLVPSILSWVWPRRGPVRMVKYIFHRIARMPDTPHRLAAGFASGAAVSFTPLLGLHFLLGFVLAFFTRGNLLASAIGTAVGNPWTFPFIFALAAESGELLLGDAGMVVVPEWSWKALAQEPFGYLLSFLEAIVPVIIGSVPIAVLVWLVFYGGLKALIIGYKGARLKAVSRAAEKAQKAEQKEQV